MKAVFLDPSKVFKIRSISEPTYKPYEVLVRIESTGICGSDLHYYLDGKIGDTVLQKPLILGHEFAGTVVAAGEQANQKLLGKRVAVEPGIPCQTCEWCRSGRYNVCPDLKFFGLPPDNHGALCELIAVHSDFCFPVPQSISPAEAALVEPLAVAVHSVELAGIKPGDTVAILGLGPIGIMTTAIAKILGAAQIYGTDLFDYRINTAIEYGLNFGLNASKHNIVEEIKKETKGRGVDVVIDCARSSQTPAQACLIVKPAGKVILTGISGLKEVSLLTDVARRKELTVTWCRRFRHNYPTAIKLLTSKKIEVKRLLTHSFPLEETARAFELLAKFEDNVLKVSIDQ